MLYSHLFTLLDDCKLSYEQLGDRIGVSGMTLRRWRQSPPKGALPRLYETAIRDATYQLIIEGVLAPESPTAQAIVDGNPNLAIGAALKTLGIKIGASASAAEDGVGLQGDERVIEALVQIGMSDERKRQIDDSSSMLSYFQKLGQGWTDKVGLLRKVIGSSRLGGFDKLVAYGALFYLITPFDLIPDYMPVVGLIDDYGVIAIAVAYYMRFHSRAGDLGQPLFDELPT